MCRDRDKGEEIESVEKRQETSLVLSERLPSYARYSTPMPLNRRAQGSYRRREEAGEVRRDEGEAELQRKTYATLINPNIKIHITHTTTTAPIVQQVVPLVFPLTSLSLPWFFSILTELPSSFPCAFSSTSLSFARFSENVRVEVLSAPERSVKEERREDCREWWCERRSVEAVEEEAGRRSFAAVEAVSLPLPLLFGAVEVAEEDEAASRRAFSSRARRAARYGGTAVGRCRSVAEGGNESGESSTLFPGGCGENGRSSVAALLSDEAAEGMRSCERAEAKALPLRRVDAGVSVEVEEACEGSAGEKVDGRGGATGAGRGKRAKRSACSEVSEGCR